MGPIPGTLPAAERYDVPGLSRPVEILVDEWGVPHIYAASRSDVFLAQGFNAARDRLFQIDLWRRRGHGRLSEVLGADYVEQDRANRLLLYRGDMSEEWDAYAEGTEEAVRSFVAGINAYVQWVGQDPERLPPEFLLYGYEPALWEPSDAVRFRTHGLFYNAEQEVARARTIVLSGPEADLVRQAREPEDPLAVPAGLDLALLGPDVLRTYLLAFAPVDFTAAAQPTSAQEAVAGSNNWVVAGERTATGRPLLANDPHRAITLPSLRYIAHLNAPGVDVIGAGEPGLPGISIGHNGNVAFGLTIWPADVEDLYVYELHPDDPARYLGPDGWAHFECVEETIAVRGGEHVVTRLEYTMHGPVIHRDVERGFAVALRAVWLEPGMAPYLASIGYADAADGDAFLDALRHWGAPAVNQVFATPDGDWGWQVSAKIPRRKGWDGSLPVPGDGAFTWEGFAMSPDLPGLRRSERGWFASANEMNLPPDWDNAELTTTYDWYSYARAERLAQWLEQDDAVTVATSARMQRDALSPHALRAIAALDHLDESRLRNGRELRALRNWDGVEHADSREALVFQVWLRRHLRPRLLDRRLERDGLDSAQREQVASVVLKDESFGGDLRGDLRLLGWAREVLTAQESVELVDAAFDSAFAELGRLLGTESPSNTWAWGRLHHASVTHAAYAPRASDVDPAWVRRGPLPRGGSGDTVGMAGYDQSFRQSIGSTFRMVIDVGSWDDSVAMNSPGQSGDPRSAHYTDLFEPWVAGETFPLLYSRSAVEDHVVARITLMPATEGSLFDDG